MKRSFCSGELGRVLDGSAGSIVSAGSILLVCRKGAFWVMWCLVRRLTCLVGKESGGWFGV